MDNALSQNNWFYFFGALADVTPIEWLAWGSTFLFFLVLACGFIGTIYQTLTGPPPSTMEAELKDENKQKSE